MESGFLRITPLLSWFRHQSQSASHAQESDALAALLAPDVLRQALLDHQSLVQWREDVSRVLAEPGRDHAQNEQILNATADGNTPLGKVCTWIDDDFGRRSDPACVMASLLVQAGANPLKNDQAFQRNLKAGRSTKKVGERGLLLLDLMRQREQTQSPVRSDTGGNAIHAMLGSCLHAATDLLHDASAFKSVLAPQWFNQVDDNGDTPLHLMWQGAGMGGICAYAVKEEESPHVDLMADALWNALAMGSGGMVDLTATGSQGKPLYAMVLDMVALGVPVREQHLATHARVCQCARAQEEATRLETQTARAPAASAPGRIGRRL